MANISQNFEDNEYDIVIKYDENIMHKKFDAILMHNDIDDEDEDIYIIKKQPSIFDSCFLKFCVRRLDI